MTLIEYDKLYVVGNWITPATSNTIPVHSATTEERIGVVPEGAEADIDTAVAAARNAFDDPQGWARWEPARRAETLERFAVALEKRAGETQRRVSLQNGMPIWLAQQFEGPFPPLLLRYYGGLVSDVSQEEIFGPVLSVIPYSTDDEAIAIANASDYGLGGSVWTTDPERGEAVARRVSTGTIGINACVNDPTAPFGGVKASGMGRRAVRYGGFSDVAG
jgi:acyl-CoA reductase-like NAD-dependent aldehyde dehydrogenase